MSYETGDTKQLNKLTFLPGVDAPQTPALQLLSSCLIHPPASDRRLN